MFTKTSSLLLGAATLRDTAQATGVSFSARCVAGWFMKSLPSLKRTPRCAFSPCHSYAVIRGYNNMKCISVSVNTGMHCQSGDRTHPKVEEQNCSSFGDYP